MFLQFSRLSLKHFNRQFVAFLALLMKTFHAEGDENIHHVLDLLCDVCFLSLNPKAMKCFDSQWETLTLLHENCFSATYSILEFSADETTLKLHLCGKQIVLLKILDINNVLFSSFIHFTMTLESYSKLSTRNSHTKMFLRWNLFPKTFSFNFHELASFTCHRLECFLVTKSLWITFRAKALCANMRRRTENRIKYSEMV